MYDMPRFRKSANAHRVVARRRAVKMFSMDSTEGFSQDDIDVMNEVLDMLVAAGVDEKNASDMINDAWQDGATVDDLLSNNVIAAALVGA